MDFLIKAAQLILSLSIIVVLHEFGHFLPAKYFKTRVEKFYLFFDPWFSIWKKKIGDTVYGLGWLPLGGYVKISGMVDESMDRDQMNSEPEPWEFRAKPSWQRLIIITGGVFVNLVLGMLIYAMLMFIWGTEKLPVRNATYGYQVDSTLMEFGFQNGDIPIRFGQQEPEYFSDLGKTMILSDSRDVEVLREGRTVNFKLPEDWKDKVLDENKRGLFALQVPFIVDTIIPGGTAAQSDLQKGDRIVGFNDIETPYFSTFRNKIGDFKDKTIQLKVERNGQAITLPVNVNSKGLLGVGNTNPIDYFEFETLNYTFFEAIPAGIVHGYNTLSNYVSSLKLLFTKSGAKQMGGFGTIGSLFPSTWDWQTFWNLTAFISIILAFMNILPIPALDGGHAVFILYEMFTGRQPKQKVLEVAQMVGMFLLLALVLFANANDIYKFLIK